mmetsp:Transcript_31461/g.80016  ORF Transcript_31461/g.80016 Transcript_31461/m.80016 type:complete len:235 (+) Transcript_31461:1502-2206(+)
MSSVACVIRSPRGLISSAKVWSFMLIMVPKMRLTWLSSGKVKLTQWNLDWKRWGRRERPPPGGPTDPMMLQSLMCFLSCLRRSYQKPCSIQTLRSSRGGMEPKVSRWGMFMSSMKMTIFLPAGGAKVSLVRFSTLASIMSCTLLLEVWALNCMPSSVIESGLVASTCWMSVVLPAPTGPDTMTSRWMRMRASMRKELRAESTVGTRILWNWVSGELRKGLALTFSSHVVHCIRA